MDIDLNGSGITSRAAIIASTASCLPETEYRINETCFAW
jgi:hypothetical protein